MSQEIIDAAKDFFLVFSKFEYSLKSAGFCKAARSKVAEVDWNKFYNSLGTQTITISSNENIEYFLDNPPNEIHWDKTSQTTVPYTKVKKLDLKDIKQIIKTCKTVRNNLFHGNKFNNADIGRNIKLIKAAEDFIKQIAQQHTALGAIYLFAQLGLARP